MSTLTYVVCDMCDNQWYEDDAPYMIEGVETWDGCWYEHVCDDCMETLGGCEWCDRLFDNDDLSYCETIGGYACDDCLFDAHENRDEWCGICDDCGHEDESFETSTGSWAKVIG